MFIAMCALGIAMTCSFVTWIFTAKIAHRKGYDKGFNSGFIAGCRANANTRRILAPASQKAQPIQKLRAYGIIERGWVLDEHI